MLTGEDFDVNNPCSVVPNRLDYFYQFQNPNDPDGVVKYIGESIDADYLGLIADHDFMEDVVEDGIGFNLYVYDANIDTDGNGWDNWSEVRARYNEATWVVDGVETNTYTRTFNSFTPEAHAQWRMWIDTYWNPRALDKAWGVSAKHYNANGDLIYEETSSTLGLLWTIPASDERCVVTWYELEDKKAYGGKPLPNVNARIYGVDADVTNMTMTAYSDKNLLKPDAKFELGGKVVGGVFSGTASVGSLKQGLNTFVVTNGAMTGFARNVNVGFDRVDVDVVLRSDAIAFDVPPQSNATTRVRIQRTAINGTLLTKPLRTVYAKTLDLRKGKKFTEADLLKSGEWDFDQKYLVKDAFDKAGIDAADIRSADYEVYLGTDDSTNLTYTFTRTFPATLVAPVPSGATAQHGNVVEAARPTLAWQAPDGASAFMLEVAKDEAFSEIIYTTTNFMPAATTEGCQFKPDLYVGAELDDATTYYWRVASVDSVKTSVWSDVATFRTAVNVDNADTGYGRIAAEVRYFGPSAAVLSDVVVGVYESADFTSEPVARKRLVGDDPVSTLTNDLTKAFDVVTTNIVLDGIAPGKYYVMAFIDSNTNNVRDAWESWGYVNNVGTEATDLYTPAALTVKSTKAMPPTAFLVMEDTDVNQNWTPDCLEDLEGWTPASAIKPVDSADVDGDGLTGVEEDDYGCDPLNADSDGDGMPDGWETMFAGTDPLFNDAISVVNGDVMAYAEETWKLVTDASGACYLLNPTNKTVHVGDDLSLSQLVATYDYPVTFAITNSVHKYGVGTNLVDGATTFRVAKVEDVSAVLVHAQVYAAYGFNPLTANTAAYAAGEAVNTKEFTALDKYLLIRYFEALGLCTEADVNANRDWANFSLKPNDADNDRDGVYDGWELYVMFGPDGATDTLAAAPISPFNYDDARTVAPAAGSQLTVLEAFDDGNSPTDPWNVKTLPLDGITDKEAYDYALKTAEDQLADFDNDGLSNWAEYLASKLTGEKFDVTNPTNFNKAALRSTLASASTRTASASLPTTTSWKIGGRTSMTSRPYPAGLPRRGPRRIVTPTAMCTTPTQIATATAGRIGLRHARPTGAATSTTTSSIRGWRPARTTISRAIRRRPSRCSRPTTVCTSLLSASRSLSAPTGRAIPRTS